MKPFLKWAGGKGQLLPYIIPKIRQYITPQARFHEPFVGGGAVFIKLNHKRVHINDLNRELINTYKVVKFEPGPLIEKLKEHAASHSETHYYRIRALDRDKGKFQKMTRIERAARTIYLNKTCYNGLYRVNREGKFNTPIGYYENPNIVDEDNILAVSDYLRRNRVKITNLSFKSAVRNAVKGDFIYFDPPYDYSDKGFTTYTRQGFNHYDLDDLKECSDALIHKGCYVLISNNDTEYVRTLFDDNNYEIDTLPATNHTVSYDIEEIPANRTINSKGDGRNKVQEVLIFGRKKQEIPTSKLSRQAAIHY